MLNGFLDPSVLGNGKDGSRSIASLRARLNDVNLCRGSPCTLLSYRVILTADIRLYCPQIFVCFKNCVFLPFRDHCCGLHIYACSSFRGSLVRLCYVKLVNDLICYQFILVLNEIDGAVALKVIQRVRVLLSTLNISNADIIFQELTGR